MHTLSDWLPPADMDLIRDCLRASVEGPFFPNWEFPIIMGIERKQMRAVLEAWPRQTVDDDTFACATINALNNLTGYPHRKDAKLLAYVPAGRKAILATLWRLDALIRPERGRKRSGDYLM